MSNKTGILFIIIVGVVLLVISRNTFKSTSLPEIGSQEFNQLVDQSDLVLAKFGAPWCGPCRQVDGELSKLKSLSGDQVDVVAINVDNEADLARQYNITSIPRLMLFRNGEKIHDSVGYVDVAEMQRWIREAGNGI